MAKHISPIFPARGFVVLNEAEEKNTNRIPACKECMPLKKIATRSTNYEMITFYSVQMIR